MNTKKQPKSEAENKPSSALPPRQHKDAQTSQETDTVESSDASVTQATEEDEDEVIAPDGMPEPKKESEPLF
ncbi:MAG TPA: hypothetical protein VFZ34_14580 [Blastocatellia bacterium]|nr:hypothetical protein [Blastocatellia bacterium]